MWVFHYIMGGTQSQYTCDKHVAAHIKSRPPLEQELNSCVQGKAKLASFEVVDGNGVVSYTLKYRATVEECKSKLDEFFQKFMTFSESYDPIKVPYHYISYMAFLTGLDCTIEWDKSNHSVQITGNNNDVKKMIKKLQEYQNPPKPPVVPTVTVNNPLPKKSFSFTCSLATLLTAAAQPDTTTSRKKILSHRCPAKDYHVAEFIKQSARMNELKQSLSRIATLKIVAKGKDRLEYHFTSNEEVDEDEVEMFKDSCKQVLNEFTSQFSHWSSKYPANQIQKAMRQSSSVFSCTQDVIVKVDNSYLSIIGLNEIVQGRKEEMLKAMQMARKKILSHRCPANDYHVAEFINQTSTRMNELKQSLSRIATLKIVAKGKDILEYQFTSNEEMFPEDQTQFESECLEKLNKFLVKFTSWEKTYSPSVLKMAAIANDRYLQHITGPRLVRFLHENNFVLVGVKSEVEKMKTEILHRMEHYQREHQRTRRPSEIVDE
ncbi:uncharacterized protein LOC144743410 [Ciona intestinalis]